MPELRRQAGRVERAGRGRDTELVHMTPREIMAMEAWAGRRMPRNPRTGLREAGLWDSITSTVSDIGSSFTNFVGNPLGVPGFDVKSFSDPFSLESYSPTSRGAAGATAGEFLLGGAGAGGGEGVFPGFEGAAANQAAEDAAMGAGLGGAGTGAGASAIADWDAAFGTGTNLGDPNAGTGMWAGNTYSGGDVVPFGAPGDLSSMAFEPGPPPFDLGGGLGVDASGNVSGGLFEGGPGTPGGGDFASRTGLSDYWRRFKGLPWKGIGTGLNIGGGLFGIYNAAQVRRMAQQAQDPHLREYQDRLNALTRDPSSVTQMPGYQFGLDEGRRAIQRQGAATGGGGNEAIALARYTPAYAQQFYENQVRDLSSMSRGDSAGVQGNALAMQLANQALWQLGYGAMSLGGR
jgi:hypothetical protein